MGWLEPLLYAVLLWLGLKLLVLLVNLFSFPVLRGGQDGPFPEVSLLVPVRNEAHNLRKTLPGLLRQEVGEVLLLDDGSTDGTAGVVETLARGDRRVRLIPGRPKPEGWVGKAWACHQLAQVARGEVLIFTDADVCWREGGVGAVLDFMRREGAGLVSVYPRQVTPTLLERVLLPLIDDVLLCYLPYPLVRTPFPQAAAANGQVMAFQREAYCVVGGHAAVRGEVLEDVRLAQRAKARGVRLAVALGDGWVSVRMYRSYAEVVEGLGKNLIEFHARSRWLLLLSYLAHLLAYTLCWPLALVDPLWLWVGGMGFLERVMLGLKTGRDGWEFLLVPLAPLLSAPIYWRSAQRRYTWKGREYTR
ncbi:MAG: glycosyltransferase [Meiothermus sp.]|uniref:glycosyltransferase n=1 Tax=Meiothermus sp. TaxID=1955249 RepID=UPI0025D4882D|nr:glycosyltransferase family 2 protein [Meiothermus sp.]MCS7193601.1 glycosyltransferase [Meiothermus sp.]MDW8090615.1 glycosyltransferase family 2 protein [Meiothermus sp.]MDW8480531.1 glycosyltransferase family 2 protein [Meiothermus sp.]